MTGKKITLRLTFDTSKLELALARTELAFVYARLHMRRARWALEDLGAIIRRGKL